MSREAKETMLNRPVRKGEYAMHNGNSANHRNVRTRRPTQPLAEEDLATLRSFPKAGVTPENGVTFNLSSRECEFIQECANKWNVPYEMAVGKVVHDALDCLQQVSRLSRKYDER